MITNLIYIIVVKLNEIFKDGLQRGNISSWVGVPNASGNQGNLQRAITHL